jgi:uncharacterized protein
LPDLYAEGFSAAVDFLGTRPFIDKERIVFLGSAVAGALSSARLRLTRE